MRFWIEEEDEYLDVRKIRERRKKEERTVTMEKRGR